MITKNTVVDQIEVTRNGIIQIRVGLELLGNGVPIAPPKWVRTSCAPGDNVEQQMASVNGYLSRINENTVSDADIAKIRAQANAAWTPEVISAYQAMTAQ